MTRKILVYIQGSFANRQTGEVFEDHPSGVFTVVKHIAAADVVVWTGGADIGPDIYNHRCLPGTGFSSQRDKEDLWAIEQSKGKVLVGVCRGAQLLNCNPNGGTLFQHVNNHSGYHKVKDYETGDEWVINSYHHQMCRVTKEASVIAGCSVSTSKEAADLHYHRELRDMPEFDIDPEVIWYPKTYSLLFQGHPEFGHPETTKYFYELIDRFVIPAVNEIESRREAMLA